MGVGSQDWSEHLGRIRQFLEIMRRIDMSLNLAKCEFAKPEVKFVGHFWAPGNEDQTLSVWKVLLRWSDPGPKRSFANYWELCNLMLFRTIAF